MADSGGMKTKLSHSQKSMLKTALVRDGGKWGYAPCGKGFASTMRSLERMGLGVTTGDCTGVRGIILSVSGREIARQLVSEEQTT